MAHTPGPWAATENRGGWLGPVITAEHAPHGLATVNGDYPGNARLIAAAPELLAALKQAVTALNVAKRFRVLDKDSYQIAAMCDAAIAKAEGRE